MSEHHGREKLIYGNFGGSRICFEVKLCVLAGYCINKRNISLFHGFVWQETFPDNEQQAH
jgi:hypothetical protein